MLNLIRLTGPWGVILTALAVLILVLAGWSGVSMLKTEQELEPSLKNRINAVLFWGAFGAVVGVLGQLSGVYTALRVVSRAPEVSPPVVMEGFAISFLTTILGLVIFLASGLAWLGLRSMHNRLNPQLQA